MVKYKVIDSLLKSDIDGIIKTKFRPYHKALKKLRKDMRKALDEGKDFTGKIMMVKNNGLEEIKAELTVTNQEGKDLNPNEWKKRL